MPVRSQRVTGVVVVTGSSTLVYTVPAGRTFRGAVTITNRSAAAAACAYTVNGTAYINQFWGSVVPAYSSAALAGVVLNPGDTLYAFIVGGGPANVIVYGSLLLGAPA
jgi:hypothetical protein